MAKIPLENSSTFTYTCHIYGAKDSKTFANYVLRRTAADDEEEPPVVFRIVKLRGGRLLVLR